MPVHRRVAHVLPFLLAACGGSVTGDDDGWDEDWNDTPPLTVCATGGADHATLGDAIAAAPSGSTLEICAGTYPERLVIEGKALYLRGAGEAVTVLDAGGLGTALEVRGDAEVRLDGLAIQHGDGALEGGGISCRGAHLRLVDTAVRDNRATRAGGGLFADGCELLLERAVFERNEGTDQGGGAALVNATGELRGGRFSRNAADQGGGLIVVGGTLALHEVELTDNDARVRGGGAFVAADTTLEACNISANRAGWTGGGVHVDQHAPTLTGNTIANNTSVEEGGGVYLHQSTALLQSNVVADNTTGDDGGGVRLFESRGRLVGNLITRNHAAGDGGGVKISHLPGALTDNEITENVAGGSGGGIELDNDSSVITGGHVSTNQAGGRGGGIHVQLWPWNDGRIENVILDGNRANDGGGLHVDRSFQLVTLRHLTITNNRANQGGGIYAQGAPMVLTNAVIAGNRANREGGAIYAGTPDPWVEPCPCPPEGPAMSFEFVVAHANQAATAAGLYQDTVNVTVESSIFDDHAGAAVVVAPLATPPAWRYNDLWPAGVTGMADPTGQDGNLALPPAFQDAAAGDFRLLVSSPCVDAGDPADRDPDGSRADMGFFAGPNAP